MKATLRTFALFLPVFLCVSAAQAQVGSCGHPLNDPPSTADALFTLRASVGSSFCSLCVCDVNESGDVTATDALLVLNAAVGLAVALGCPECDPSDQCPGVAQFALFAKIRGACTTNSECAGFSVCDTNLGRCRTRTDVDVGWTGFGHNADIDDPIPARVFLGCEGPAPCGMCEITGHDPSLGNCRCENDNRQRCFTVAGPDQENCGGGQCTCNFGPPLPLVAGGTPVCVLNTLAEQPGGEADVDAGDGTIQLHLLEKVFLGELLLQPCPLCVNDPTPADGQRGGVCSGGLNDTDSCDAQAYNYTFPAPTGAFHSLDCFPNPGNNVAGPGLSVEIALTTGQSQLAAELPCATEGELAEFDCFCRVCSGDGTIACSSNEDCGEAGTCTSNGEGVQTLPNDCDDGVCESVGGEEGRCAVGPDDTFCDGLLRPDGRGLLPCGANDDCAPQHIGVDAGECILVERRPCFLDPIVAQGAPHPVIPLAAGVFCSPPTNSGPVNSASGLPGPGRATLQTAVSLFCKGDPHSTYTPGSGGCP